MRDDEMMDELLRSALAAPPPRISENFDVAVMRRAVPRRLTWAGRTMLLTYVVVSAATCLWFMRDLPPWLIVGALAAGVVASLGSKAYVTHLARGM